MELTVVCRGEQDSVKSMCDEATEEKSRAEATLLTLK